MQNKELKIKNGDITLAGTLTTPLKNGPHPLVICIHGSGPLDRDSNTAYQKLNIFNVLAENLASRNIACFRYDKRGIGQSTGDYMSAGHLDFVKDTIAITKHFRNSDDISQIFLLGHSEGTLIAPQVAQECDIEGLLLLCPFITELEQLLEMQGAVMQDFLDQSKGPQAWIPRLVAAINGGVVKGNRKLIRRVRNSSKPVLWHGFKRVEAKWIRELLNISPSRVFETIQVPTLVFVAGKDAQCPPEEGAEIAKIIGEKATHVLIPCLSHILRIEGDKSGYADYGEQLKRAMAPEVVQTVGDWIEAEISK